MHLTILALPNWGMHNFAQFCTILNFELIFNHDNEKEWTLILYPINFRKTVSFSTSMHGAVLGRKFVMKYRGVESPAGPREAYVHGPFPYM
jgi:hypothetical protein